ncbi:cytochrome P450 704C1-like isoform X2 [Phoenix dactylifera]|uniref:Cytochrome P450 704C1 isoform X2 n=1 Tax=Phoenix dactylifera TaxID=42345 RepID=A0A8B8ZW30_PHODC|nr:cytochrome P450 704C1 isoform X2 [Phoenix dactylifera]XP_038977577.1 cytochrome P450 704C1-like isoform X2 [Phoenix dactylifera]
MFFLSDPHPLGFAAMAAALILLAVAFAFGVLIVWRSLGKATRKKKRYPPVAGTIFHHFLNFGRLHDYSTSLARKHKTYRLLSPFCSEVYTADPANVEFILKTNFSNYGKGQYNYNNMKDLLGDGIFAVDGEKWYHQRKVASVEFSKSVLRDYSNAVFISNATKLASVISEAVRSSKIVDIQDLFMKSTMDSIFQVAFGVEIDSLCGSNEEGSKFAEAFDDSSALTTWRYVDISWKIKKLLNIGSEAVLNKRIQVVDDFVYKVIDNKIKQHDLSKKEDFLSRFLVESQQDPEKITHKYLRDIILNFMVAGKDTTAVTLSWLFYMLCKHPSVEEKIVEELILATKEIGNDASIGEFAASLTEETIDKMQYLHATLSETLRLYPAVPLNPKICFADDTLPDGHDVKKGDMVVYMPYVMGRMKFIWGDDAEDFRPERWLNSDGVFSPESPFKFTAFQAGPRICLGKELAYRQMKIFAALLLSFFRFKLSNERQPVNYRTMLTLQIDKGLHLYAFHR